MAPGRGWEAEGAPPRPVGYRPGRGRGDHWDAHANSPGGADEGLSCGRGRRRSREGDVAKGKDTGTDWQAGAGGGGRTLTRSTPGECRTLTGTYGVTGGRTSGRRPLQRKAEAGDTCVWRRRGAGVRRVRLRKGRCKAKLGLAGAPVERPEKERARGRDA